MVTRLHVEKNGDWTPVIFENRARI